MLVLTRTPGKSIVLPSLDVTITVLAVRRDHVRLGINAPDGCMILRAELARGRDEAAVEGVGAGHDVSRADRGA